jgi:hypothetical protein
VKQFGITDQSINRSCHRSGEAISSAQAQQLGTLKPPRFNRNAGSAAPQKQN